MTDLVGEVVQKIEDLNLNLSAEELSAFSAGFHDILESRDRLRSSLERIRLTTDADEIQDALVEIQMELVHHIKPHIVSIEGPLMRVISKLG